MDATTERAMQDELAKYLGDRVWLEDDCTTNDPKHETLSKAMKRLGIEKLDNMCARVLDFGDGAFFVYPTHVAYRSYPGNNAIYLRKEPT